MKTKGLEKNNLVLLIFIFGVFLFYNQSCEEFVFLEYINLKFFDNQTSSETYFTVHTSFLKNVRIPIFAICRIAIMSETDTKFNLFKQDPIKV